VIGRTVADVLRDYHRQPEYKFLGGGWNEEGILRRRHVVVDKIEDIGKESDGWEEDEARSDDRDTVLSYPSSSFDRERMAAAIKSVGKRELMREARIAMRTIDAVRAGKHIDDQHLKRMAEAAERLRARADKATRDVIQVRAWLVQQQREQGLKSLAKSLSVDAANLGKVIFEKRNPSTALLTKITQFMR
jgi:hypothetical protein